MSGTIIFLLALLPIATVFLLLVVLERSAKFSMLIAYLVTVLTALFVWGTDYTKVLGATVNGVVTAVSLLYIVFGPLVRDVGLTELIGVDRVLTSGGARTALEGTARLRALVVQSAGRIAILAGAGVRASNVRQVVAESGVNEVHSRLIDAEGEVLTAERVQGFVHAATS